MTNVLEQGIRAKGRRELERFLDGEALTRNEQILAKCYDCMAGYADGAGDCGCKHCPLYPSHPYNPNRIKRAVSEKHRERLSKMGFKPSSHDKQ